MRAPWPRIRQLLDAAGLYAPAHSGKDPDFQAEIHWLSYVGLHLVGVLFVIGPILGGLIDVLIATNRSSLSMTPQEPSAFYYVEPHRHRLQTPARPMRTSRPVPVVNRA